LRIEYLFGFSSAPMPATSSPDMMTRGKGQIDGRSVKPRDRGGAVYWVKKWRGCPQFLEVYR